MSTELTEPLSVPFSEIGDTLGVNFSPSVIGVAGRAYLLDNESGEYRREGINVLQQRNTTSNRDLLLLPQDVWRQMFESWHQGAGQSNLDRDDALPFRFYESFGVDVWTKYRVSLLHDTFRLQSFPSLYQSFLVPMGDSLAVINGSDLSWYTDPSTAPTTAPTQAGVAVSVASDGEFIYLLDDAGMIRRITATSNDEVTLTMPAPLAGIANATFIAYVKDYLILGVGNQLWNITDPAKPVLVYTSPVPGFTWKQATAGDAAIYLIGGVGDKHVVHRVAVAQDGTRLDPAAVAATLPDGEIGVSIGSYLGFVFIGTTNGVRMATPQGAAGDLVLGAVIPTQAPVYGFEGQDRFVWYTLSKMDGQFGQNQEGFPSDPVPGLGRMDLTTYTVTEGTPAYANDLVANGAVGGDVTAVATWQGVRVFATTGGVYVEDKGTLMERGWVTHGTVSFGVEDMKTGLYAQFKWLPLSGSVGMFAAYDSQRYTLLEDKDIPESIRSGNVPMNGQQFSRVNIGLVLRRDPLHVDSGPIVSRWEFRAVPVKGVASRWYLPILNRSQIELNGVVESRDVRAELVRLMTLVQRGGMFQFQEGGLTYSVTPKDFRWVPETLSPSGHAWQGTYLLIVEEIA